MNVKPIKETLCIEGSFGPLQAEETVFEIAPLTVFVGPQGTGKSLISQMLYFFQDSSYLFNKYRKALQPEEALRRVIEGMRVGDLNNRPLASFLGSKTVRLEYGHEQHGKKVDRAFSINRDNKKIRPLKPFTTEIDRWYTELADPTQATLLYPSQSVFIPTERLYYSRFIYSDPAMLGHSVLPITMREFARVMTQSLSLAQEWSLGKGKQSKEIEFIAKLAKDALGGEPKYATMGRYAGRWQWQPSDSKVAIEIEMTSSGQMEAWPLVMVAQGLLGLPEDERPKYLHIEEPEAHLHPRAQINLTKILAFLVQKGFRIIVTTHSLDVLYMFNNLTLAAQKLKGQQVDGYPEPEIQLQPEQIGGYLFANRRVENIVHDGQVDEGKLGEILDDLQIQYNHLMTYGTLWK